jgi:nucleoside-diphosphate-sugar epimerase
VKREAWSVDQKAGVDRMSQKTVLLVGGGGFIGRHAARQLAAAGHTVFATHTPGRRPDDLAGVAWIPADLTSDAAPDSWPATCDAVVFLAQSRHWRAFPEGERDVLAVNVAGLMRAAWYARRAGARSFVYTSSGSIYVLTGRPAVESEPLNLLAGRTFYSASKLAAEILLRPYEAFFSPVILRLFMPYGPGQEPNMLLPNLVRSVRQGQAIKLHGDHGLTANPVAVTDVVATIERCLALDKPATLNVAGPEAVTLQAIGQTIGRVIGREAVFASQPGTPPVLVADTQALRETLGWAPCTTLEEGLRWWLERETVGQVAA